MFAEHTVDSIVALANLDKGVTDRERDALQMVLLGKRLGGGCAVVKYKVAAQRLGLSVAAVKKLVKTGRLKKVTGSGSAAIGVTEESLERFAS